MASKEHRSIRQQILYLVKVYAVWYLIRRTWNKIGHPIGFQILGIIIDIIL